MAYLGAWVAVQPGSDRLQLKASERLGRQVGLFVGAQVKRVCAVGAVLLHLMIVARMR